MQHLINSSKDLYKLLLRLGDFADLVFPSRESGIVKKHMIKYREWNFPLEEVRASRAVITTLAGRFLHNDGDSQLLIIQLWCINSPGGIQNRKR